MAARSGSGYRSRPASTPSRPSKAVLSMRTISLLSLDTTEDVSRSHSMGTVYLGGEAS